MHDIRRTYVEGLAAAGYPHLPLEELLACRIHEVTPDFIAQLRSLGYEQVPLEDLIALRVHEVTIDFIERQRAKGEKPSIEDPRCRSTARKNERIARASSRISRYLQAASIRPRMPRRRAIGSFE